MGKRYYCDYCDRSFKDDTDARKKHITSLQHINNRAEHYRLFKDPEDILKEEAVKKPCKNLMTYGDCMFGSNCRFSHYSPPMIWELQRLADWKRSKIQHETVQMPDANEIISEFFQNTIINNDDEMINYPTWSLPSELQNYPNLPPSLWPITPQTVTDSNFPKWG